MILPPFMFVKKNLNRKKEKKGCVTIGEALFYYKLRQPCYKLGQLHITSWGSYYKLEQPLLQNREAITNWGKIYQKLEQVLQIRAIITNWGITAGGLLLKILKYFKVMLNIF